MRLYHGSYTVIKAIDLQRSLRGKDFGRGFYLSADYAHAEDIARLRALSVQATPVVNAYEFDERVLEDGMLRVQRFEDYTVDWAQFVLANRQNQSDDNIHDFDVVIGPIADDRVGLQIRRLLDGEIDIDEFLRRLQYMKGMTFQYFFGTERAVRHLKAMG